MIHRTRESIAADVDAFIRKHGESAIQKIPRGVMTDVEETRKDRQDASDWFNRAKTNKTIAPKVRTDRAIEYLADRLAKL